MKIKLFIISIFICCSLSVWSSNPKEDKKKTDETQPVVVVPEGIIYSLPRTGVEVKVKAVKETYKPGPYSQYAAKYLGYQNVKANPSENWKVVDIAVTPIGEADPDAVFKTSGLNGSLVSLLSDGSLSGLNSPSSTCFPAVLGSDNIVTNELPSVVFPNQSADDYYDMEINTATGEERMVIKSEETKAREAAEYLFRLRKKSSYFSFGQNDAVPEDGQAFEAFVRQAEKNEKEYLSLFVGKSFSSEHEFTFVFFPGNENVKNEVLFRFSEDKGILPKTDISGKPIMIEMIKDQKAFSAAQKLNSENENVGDKALFYRVPVNSSFSISDGINTFYTGKMPVAQFGVIAPVPEMFLDGSYQLSFDSVTGAIRNCSKLK